jgi:galactonate dehydratase
VYELLGGKTRDKIRVYASVMTKENDPKVLAKGYKALKEQGFTAAKIFVNGPVHTANDGRDEFYSGRIEDELEKVRLCREAVGNDFDFVLEAHRGMTKPEAIAFGTEVARYRPMVLEDPMTPDNIDSMAEIAAKIPVPIATGERFTNLREFEMLMQRHAAQYIRPDVCAVGGITTSKKICAVAEANDVLVIPHNPLGPVSTAACLQICASIPNLGIQELPGFCLNGTEDAMVKQPLRFENGCMLIPEAPGIGVELAENATELYPANERGSNEAKRAFDGSVKDW